jgi:hypothetical protein
MPDLLLRRNPAVKAYKDDFLVLAQLDDGHEIELGHISRQTGAAGSEAWAWSCPGSIGREDTLEAAMSALQKAWGSTVSDLAKMRKQ